MKLISFDADAVFQSYRFGMDFNSDINFIVGINGTGKTTALRLIQAILTVNVRELLLINFKDILLVFEHESRNHRLSVQKSKNKITFSMPETQADSIIEIFEKDEIEQYAKTGRLDEVSEELRFRFLREKSNISEFLSKIPAPIFIGLERRLKIEELDSEEDSFRISSMRLARNLPHLQRNSQGTDGLENARRLIRNEYRKFRLNSDRLNDKVVNVIVKSTFQYIELDDSELFLRGENRYDEYQKLLARRPEIEQVAGALVGGQEVTRQIEGFFKNLERAYASVQDKEKPSVMIEWLLNKAQIQRIHEILKELDTNKKRAAALYKPINEFIEVANFFFGASKKEVSIDSVGELIIQRNNQNVPLPSLSSGERQLLTLLAHVVFMPKRNPGIIIIDEPELSLHLRWQENLVPKLCELNSAVQFIFATHSPEIVGIQKNKTLRVMR